MKIEFISYDGKYPNLCSGRLTLLIDGKETTFGEGLINKSYDKHADYGRFWTSGGTVTADKDWNFNVTTGPWELWDSFLPDFLKPYGEQLIEIFNENTCWGCCGGCI